MGIREREFTDDRVPITDEEVFPSGASDYTEESVSQLAQDLVGLLDEENGLIDENTLLEESPVYDTDIGGENLENDYAYDD